MRNRLSIVWMVLFLCPLAFDFRGDEQGSHLTQILLAAPALFGGFALILTGPRFTGSNRLRSLVTMALCLTIFGSLVTQLLMHNPFGNYLRVLLPFVLFLMGYMVACKAWESDRIEQLERVLFYAMVMSMVFSFVNGLHSVGGKDIADVRFRIVSPVLLAMQAMLLHEFVISRRITKVTAAVFAASVLIELYSVTRSLALGTVLLFCYATWLGAPSMKKLVKAGVRAVFAAILIGGVVVAGASLSPEVASHWMERVNAAKATGSGMDPTTATRLAELTDQFDQTTSSTASLLIGRGYGHSYRYSPKYMWALMETMSKKDYLAIDEWAAGHNFWVYQFFGGGLLFGLGLPFALLYGVWRGGRAYRKWRREAPDMPYLPVLGRGLLMSAAMVAVSIGGNPLGPRFSGLVFGFALGLLVTSYSRLSRMVAVRVPVEAPDTQMDPPPLYDYEPTHGYDPRRPAYRQHRGGAYGDVYDTEPSFHARPPEGPQAETSTEGHPVPLLFGPETRESAVEN